MRMKFNKSRQLALVSAASLAVASLVTACSQFTQTLTVDFVYVASATAAGPNQYGQIDVEEINSESGAMRPIPSSPFPSGGRDPVAEAVSTDYGSLFVSNQDDNTIVQFVIGTDGKLYPYYTVNTPGIYPAKLAISKNALFSVALYEPLPTCSTAAPCSGAISVFPLAAGGSSSSAPCTATVCLQSPATNSALSTNYWPLIVPGKTSDIVVPTAVAVLASGSDVYVTAYDSSVSPSIGYVFGYSVGAGGVLTALAGSPYVAGVQPAGIASDASTTSPHVYVTDYKSGDVLSFAVSANSANAGALSAVGAYAAGDGPSGIVVNPTYPYAYVVNSLDATISAYSVSNGVLTRLGTSTGGGTYQTGEQPIAIGVDPSTNRFLYTINFLGSDLSGYEISTTDGSLLVSQNSPYGTNTEPTAVAAIPHNGTGGGIQP